MATVAFVKQRWSLRRRLYFVTFVGPAGSSCRQTPWHYLFALEHAGHEWGVIGEGGGTGVVPPVRAEPRVWLEGAFGDNYFYAGGRIAAAGYDIDRVRLHFGEGSVLEADTENDVALFITDRPVRMPTAVALLDKDGITVGEHPWHPSR